MGKTLVDMREWVQPKVVKYLKFVVEEIVENHFHVVQDVLLLSEEGDLVPEEDLMDVLSDMTSASEKAWLKYNRLLWQAIDGTMKEETVEELWSEIIARIICDRNLEGGK